MSKVKVGGKTFSMSPLAIKRRLLAWARDLESGKYKQGEGSLKFREDHTSIIRHCCLGVVRETFDLPWVTDGCSEFAAPDPNGYPNCGVLPPIEAKLFGLVDGDVDILADLNDGGLVYLSEEYDKPTKVEPYSFHEIAEVIRLYARECV